jgi:hypothetical protein
MLRLIGLFGVAALLLCTQAARAVTIVNGSFEDGPILPSSGGFSTFNSLDSTSMNGWFVASPVDLIDQGYRQASDGTKSLNLNGRIEQELTGMTVGRQYAISFDIAGNKNVDQSYTMQIRVNGDRKLYFFNKTAANTGTNMGWAAQVFYFVADRATETLFFISANSGTAGMALDNVSISETPIPPSVLLFGSALFGMGFMGYRRRHMHL